MLPTETRIPWLTFPIRVFEIHTTSPAQYSCGCTTRGLIIALSARFRRRSKQFRNGMPCCIFAPGQPKADKQSRGIEHRNGKRGMAELQGPSRLSTSAEIRRTLLSGSFNAAIRAGRALAADLPISRRASAAARRRTTLRTGSGRNRFAGDGSFSHTAHTKLFTCESFRASAVERTGTASAPTKKKYMSCRSESRADSSSHQERL